MKTNYVVKRLNFSPVNVYFNITAYMYKLDLLIT